MLKLLTVFGLFAVSSMLVCYALERRSTWWVLAFAISCWLGSAYGFLQGAWPFGLVEAVWGVIAALRWRSLRWDAPRDPISGEPHRHRNARHRPSSA